MKIYTKTGDDGTTGIQGNQRLPKSHPRIVAYGSVDEANSIIGMVLTNNLDSDIVEILTQIQNELFIAGSDLSNPNLIEQNNRITEEMVSGLEEQIDKFEGELLPLTNFILPGGEIAASQIHFARTVVRRSETNVTMLSEKEEINQICIKYLNRLSDLLFVLGRVINKRKVRKDVIWRIENDKL